ncbi:ferredoxin [bacterium]|nr:ferredoxin [bacterium]
MPKYKITIDKNKCVGSTICTMEAPEIFALGAEFQSHVIDPDSNEDELILHAAQSCPMNAIIVTERETEKRVWPPA